MKRYILTLLTVCILLLSLAAQASAASVTISPAQIEEGDTITIDISGLQDGSIFALRMEAAIELDGASSFTYQSNQVTVPFRMENPRVTLLASPVTQAGLEASDGDTIRRMTQRTQTGEVRIIQTLDTIPSGTIEVLKAFGDPVDGAEQVDISLELSGTKKGPDAGSITFGLEGISDGAARIIVLVDGSEAMNQQITIGTPPVTPTPTTPPPTGGTGGSGGSGGSGSPPPADQVSRSSLDGIVRIQTVASSVTGASPDDIRIIQSEPGSLPEDWIAVSGSYIISPAGISFQPPARLSFLMDEGAGAPFIAAYRDGAWTIVPSRVEGSSLIVEISGAGRYAMMSYHSDEPAPVATPPPPVTTDIPATTGVPPTGVPAAEQSAGGLLTLLSAGVTGLLLMGLRKRG